MGIGPYALKGLLAQEDPGKGLCLADVLVNIPLYCLGRAIFGYMGALPGGPVKDRYGVCDPPYLILSDRAAPYLFLEYCLLRKAAHLNGVLNGPALFSLHPEPTRGVAHLYHAKVYMGRKAPVETHLLVAVFMAFFKGGKVKKAEVHGFFYLVYIGRGKKEIGDMRLAEFHSLRGVGIGPLFEEFIKAALHAHDSAPFLQGIYAP